MVKPHALPEYAKVKFNKIGWLYYNAIYDLVMEIPVEKITVQMILDKTETSRGTFYKYFSDKFALMHYVHYHDILHSNMQISTENLTALFIQKRDFYKSLYAYEGQNSFREFYKHFWVNNFRCEYIEQHGQAAYTTHIDNVINFYVEGLYGLIKDWILSDCNKISEKEILNISRIFFPEELRTKPSQK